MYFTVAMNVLPGKATVSKVTTSPGCTLAHVGLGNGELEPQRIVDEQGHDPRVGCT